MFQFGGFPTYTYVFSIRFMVLHHECFHIRISADLCSFAAPRSFSQLVTSFFGSWCQGIHLMLFFAWTYFLVLSFLWIAWVSLNIFFRFVNNSCEKVISRKRNSYPFCLNLFPPCGEIVIYPNLERPINSTSDLVKIICPLICSFLTLQYTLFGFQWT